MPPRRLVLIGSFWLFSVAAAFSLGWLAGPKHGGGASTTATGSTGETAAAPGQARTAAGSARDTSMAAFFGSNGSGLAGVLGGRTLDQHVKHLLAQNDEAMRMLGFLRLLDALTSPDDLKATLDILTKDGRRGGGFRITEQAMLLQKWAKLDPNAAAGYASGLRDFSRMSGLDAVFKTWLQSNPEEAIAWAQKNGVSPRGDGPFPGGPGPDGQPENWAVTSLVDTLAKTDLQRALDLAGTQPYNRARGRMADTLVEELISQRGEQAAREAIVNVGDEQFRASLARELAERLAEKDPMGAAAWANGLPAGVTRERAMAEAIQEWASKDAVAAGQYLQQLGNSPEFDSARQEYARRVFRDDPEGALAWAQAITNEERRTAAVQEFLRAWMREDSPTAQTWAQTNGVPIVAPAGGGGPPGGFGGRFDFRGGGGGRGRGPR